MKELEIFLNDINRCYEDKEREINESENFNKNNLLQQLQLKKIVIANFKHFIKDAEKNEAHKKELISNLRIESESIILEIQKIKI